MNFLTSNNAFVTNDRLFVIACDRTNADLLGLYNMDRRANLEANSGNSFGTILKRIFRSN